MFLPEDSGNISRDNCTEEESSAQPEGAVEVWVGVQSVH